MSVNQYWLSGTAIFLALSCGFNLYLAIHGISSQISFRTFLVFCILALALTFGAWLMAGQSAKEADEQKRTLTDIENGVIKISDALGVETSKNIPSLIDDVLQQIKSLKENLEDRSFTSEQEDFIVNHLLKYASKPPKIQLSVIPDPEAQRFADKIEGLLEKAHWILEPRGTLLVTGAFQGLLLQVKDNNSYGAGELQYVLNKVGYNTTGSLGASSDVLVLQIGSK